MTTKSGSFRYISADFLRRLSKRSSSVLYVYLRNSAILSDLDKPFYSDEKIVVIPRSHSISEKI